MVWENERTTNDNVNRLVEHHFLHQAHEAVDLGFGRGNRIVFLTRTGLAWVLKNGHLIEADIAYYWRGEGSWHPLYNDHNVAVNDVLCAFIKRAREQPARVIDIRLDPRTLLDGNGENVSLGSPLAGNRLIPDRIFAVKYLDQFAECYLEVDRNTESKKIWREKMVKYLISPEVMDQPSAFVVIVANTKPRMETLMRWSKDLVDRRFVFSYLGEVCYRFSRDDKELVLKQAGNPFGRIWQNAINQEPHALFEN